MFPDKTSELFALYWLAFQMATYFNSSNRVFDVLMYLLKFDFESVHNYSCILADAFYFFILFEVELLIYSSSLIYFIKSPTYLKLVEQ